MSLSACLSAQARKT